MHYYYVHWTAGWLLSWLFWLLVLSLFIWLIVALFSPDHNSGGTPAQKDNPALQALNERYIKGEISKEEYRQKKNDILN